LNKFAKGAGVYVLMVVFAMIVVLATWQNDGRAPQKEPYVYSTLVRHLNEQKVKKIEITGDPDRSNAGRAKVYLNDDSVEYIDVVALESFMSTINEAIEGYGLETVINPAPRTGTFLQFLPTIIMVGVMIFLIYVIVQQMQGGGSGGRVMNFGRSRAKLVPEDKKKITFENVAGLEEEKYELAELVDFLKQPEKFIAIGARIPKGVLLVGPPGTGKTLLAKAVAGEAGVPFFSISGSDFVEMFVGVGASRVRDLFEQAKKQTPCIVFIDEIDAVGRRRGAGLGGGHDEREQTLNQLLVEMDGFGVNEGVIVIAATNRPDILDPALLRPGRFDRQIVVNVPDVKGREDILKVHSKGKALAEDADLKVIAQTTIGFTGADLENLLNEAALLAVRSDKKEIDMEELRKAFVKVGVGTEKKSRIITERDRRITAYHEAGHALIQEMLEELEPVHIVSVIPTGRAAGYTMPLPEEDKTHVSKKYMEQHIVSLLGGRAAEFVVLNDITTGASNDIERATGMARSMVVKYGMSDALGPVQFGNDNDEVFIGRDLAHARNYGERMASLIDSEIRRIVDKSYQNAIEIISKHIEILHKTVELLIQKEKITGAEFRGLFPAGLIDKKHARQDVSGTDGFFNGGAVPEPG